MAVPTMHIRLSEARSYEAKMKKEIDWIARYPDILDDLKDVTLGEYMDGAQHYYDLHYELNAQGQDPLGWRRIKEQGVTRTDEANQHQVFGPYQFGCPLEGYDCYDLLVSLYPDYSDEIQVGLSPKMNYIHWMRSAGDYFCAVQVPVQDVGDQVDFGLNDDATNFYRADGVYCGNQMHVGAPALIDSQNSWYANLQVLDRYDFLIPAMHKIIYDNWLFWYGVNSEGSTRRTCYGMSSFIDVPVDHYNNPQVHGWLSKDTKVPKYSPDHPDFDEEGQGKAEWWDDARAMYGEDGVAYHPDVQALLGPTEYYDEYYINQAVAGYTPGTPEYDAALAAALAQYSFTSYSCLLPPLQNQTIMHDDILYHYFFEFKNPSRMAGYLSQLLGWWASVGGPGGITDENFTGDAIVVKQNAITGEVLWATKIVEEWYTEPGEPVDVKRWGLLNFHYLTVINNELHIVTEVSKHYVDGVYGNWTSIVQYWKISENGVGPTLVRDGAFGFRPHVLPVHSLDRPYPVKFMRVGDTMFCAWADGHTTVRCGGGTLREIRFSFSDAITGAYQSTHGQSILDITGTDWIGVGNSLTGPVGIQAVHDADENFYITVNNTVFKVSRTRGFIWQMRAWYGCGSINIDDAGDIYVYFYELHEDDEAMMDACTGGFTNPNVIIPEPGLYKITPSGEGLDATFTVKWGWKKTNFEYHRFKPVFPKMIINKSWTQEQ